MGNHFMLLIYIVFLCAYIECVGADMIYEAKFSSMMKCENVIIFNTTKNDNSGYALINVFKLFGSNDITGSKIIEKFRIRAYNATARFLTLLKGWKFGWNGWLSDFNVAMNRQIQCGTIPRINEKQGSSWFLSNLDFIVFGFFNSYPSTGLNNHLIGNNSESEKGSYCNYKLDEKHWLFKHRAQLLGCLCILMGFLILSFIIHLSLNRRISPLCEFYSAAIAVFLMMFGIGLFFSFFIHNI